MSIITTVYVPEGMAMAADSRLTGYKNYPNGLTDRFAISDNSQKLFLLNKTKIGISTCGNALIDNKTVADYIRIFEIEKLGDSEDVISVADKLFKHANDVICNGSVEFLVCGYLKDEPYVYNLNSLGSTRINMHDSIITYGTSWRGEQEAADKLLLGQNTTNINFDLMPLKDAVDLAEFLVELTIKYQRFEDRVATCGGPIDILVINKDGASFVKHKLYKP